MLRLFRDRPNLCRLDFVLVMTVNPGFACQALVPSAFQKIAACRAMLDAAGRRIPIQVDGNVSFENIPEMVACGADILVAESQAVSFIPKPRPNTT